MSDKGMASGIYQLRHSQSGRVYVGSACNIEARKGQHLRQLERDQHPNGKLQNAWNKYGADAFEFQILEIVRDRELLIAREQDWMDKSNAVKEGFNIAPRAGSQLGYRFSDEVKKKLSLSHMGIKRSAESIAKTAAKLKGKPKTREHAANAGAARKGKPLSAETRLAISIAHKGKTRAKRSPETRAKIAAAHLGKPKPKHTDEQRAARSAWMRARIARIKAEAAVEHQ